MAIPSKTLCTDNAMTIRKLRMVAIIFFSLAKFPKVVEFFRLLLIFWLTTGNPKWLGRLASKLSPSEYVV